MAISVKQRKANQTAVLPTASPSVSPSVSPTPIATASVVASATPKVSATPTAPLSAADHAKRAEDAYKRQDYTTAISEYELAINGTTNTNNRAQWWNGLGNTYRDKQSSELALNAYTKAIQDNAKLGEAYLNKAALLWSQNKKEDAIATLQAGINANASDKTTLQNTLSVYEVQS